MDIQILLGLLSQLQKLRQHNHWTHQQLEAHQYEHLLYGKAGATL